MTTVFSRPTAAASTTPTSTSIYSSGTGTTAAANQEYNSQLFLKLLVTQLANQDPSSPMDSSQMVQQTASLASMEQLTSLNSTTTSTNQTQMQATATAMLGKSVTGRIERRRAVGHGLVDLVLEHERAAADDRQGHRRAHRDHRRHRGRSSVLSPP